MKNTIFYIHIFIMLFCGLNANSQDFTCFGKWNLSKVDVYDPMNTLNDSETINTRTDFIFDFPADTTYLLLNHDYSFTFYRGKSTQGYRTHCGFFSLEKRSLILNMNNNCEKCNTQLFFDIIECNETTLICLLKDEDEDSPLSCKLVFNIQKP